MTIRLTRLIVDNFRAIGHADLQGLPAALILFGLNGQGKTSVLAALQMLLHGRCRFTARDGKGAGALVRDGAKQASVTAELEITHGESPETGEPTSYITLGLTVAAKGSTEWYAVDSTTNEPVAKTRDELWRVLGCDPRAAAVAAMPDAYLASGEIGEVLAATLAGEVDPAELDGWLGEHREWVRAFAGRKRCSLGDPADLAALGKAAYEERTGQNRLLKEAKAQLEGLPAVKPPMNAKGDVLGADDLPAVTRAVAAAEARLRALHTELGQAQAARPAEEIQAERDALAAELEAARAAQVQAAEAADACLAESEQADAALTRARTDEANAVHAGHQAQNALARAEKALAALTGEDGACPTCGRKYTEALRKQLLGPLEAARDAARSAHEDARARADELRAGLQPLRDAAQGLQDRLRRLNQDRQSHAAAVARLEAQIDALDAQAEAAGEARSAVEVEADIAAAEASLERARGAVKALEALAQRAELEAHIAALEAEVAELDWAVQSFKDGELTKRLMTGGMDAFAARCSEELEAYGYRLAVDVDGKRVNVLLAGPDGELRPVALCSNGEQALAAAAVGLAHAQGGAILLLDNLNELDHAWRRGLLKRLRGYTAGSVVVASAWQTGAGLEGLAEALAPAAVAWVEGGAVAPVEQGAVQEVAHG